MNCFIKILYPKTSLGLPKIIGWCRLVLHAELVHLNSNWFFEVASNCPNHFPRFRQESTPWFNFLFDLSHFP